jgi:hypothetical protein
MWVGSMLAATGISLESATNDQLRDALLLTQSKADSALPNAAATENEREVDGDASL